MLRRSGGGWRAHGAIAIAIAACACTVQEQVVFQATSPFQEVVVTETSDRVRTLRFGEGGAVQSQARVGRPDQLLVPYVRAAMAGLVFSPEPERVLVVGLGGGSIPNFIAHNYPSAHVDAVEIDPVVVDVARDWFGVSEGDRLRLVVEDGRQFVERVSEPYDVIFLDAFGESSIPPTLTSREFLEAVRRAVGTEGVVIANVWSGPLNPLYGSMATTYQTVFDEFYLFDVPRRANRIFALLPRAATLEPAALAQRLTQLSRRLSGDLELSSLVERRDVRVTDRDFGGEVLSDLPSGRDFN